MFVEISKIGTQYRATIKMVVSGSTQSKEVFQTTEPLDEEALSEALLSLGFHQRDIFDAFAIADGMGANVKHPFFNHEN